MTSLQVNNLEVKIGERVILSNLNLEVASGKFAAILGPSGCGKTTLLRAIAGLITPSAGAIRFGNKLVSVSSLVLPPHKRNVGYVPQEGGLFPHLRVAENVAFALKGKVERAEREEIVSQMLALVGLSTFAKRFPHELSGGQQTRVALARALAIKPSLVLLDEPFSALDQALRGEISAEVVALLKESKTTALMVTHDREDALVSADVIAVMRKGSVVQYGSPAEIYLNPISADVAEKERFHNHMEYFETLRSILTFWEAIYDSKITKESSKLVLRDKSLTSRQESILKMINEGKTNALIASQLGYSESLIRQETIIIYRKLGVEGRRELKREMAS